MLIDLAPPAAPAEALAEVAAQLRLPFGFPDDAERLGALAAAFQAAMTLIESRTARALVRRRFRMTARRWESPKAHSLAIGPASALEAVVVEDALGLRKGFDLAALRLEAGAHPPRMVARVPSVLPTVPDGGYAEITFVAGYGASFAEAPPDLRRATVLLAAALYEGASGGDRIAQGVEALIEPYRAVRL